MVMKKDAVNGGFDCLSVSKINYIFRINFRLKGKKTLIINFQK
jgi:hypothetical protein